MATFYTDADLAGAGEFSDPELTLATEFTVPDGNVNWLRWRSPAAASSVNPVFRIYDESGNVVATVPLDAPLVTGAWNVGTPVAPIALPAGTYRASINTTEYLARSGFFDGGPITRGDITAVQGRFASGVAAPGGTFGNTTYFVDWDFGDAPVDPAEGTASLGLDLALSTTGSADAEGAAAVGLDLAVAATGSVDAEGQGGLGFNLAVAASGSAPNQGVVALTLGLDPDASGERASQGVASLGLGLAVAASGERDSLGSVALGLNLAVSATGSNGDVGCPIEPFPFTSSPLDGYPWTAEPVKSFTGGECS